MINHNIYFISVSFFSLWLSNYKINVDSTIRRMRSMGSTAIERKKCSGGDFVPFATKAYCNLLSPKGLGLRVVGVLSNRLRSFLRGRTTS